MSDATPPPILPEIGDEVAAPFWRGAYEGRLLIQACGDCGTPRFPPRHFCGQCGSARIEWRQSAGQGRIWSWVVAHGPTLPAFADKVPYPVIVVELNDMPGIRLVGNLVNMPGAAINSVPVETIAIDLAVTVSFERIADGVALPMWLPDP